MIDEAERHDLTIDERALSKDLGVPVIPLTARRGEGINELLNAIETVAVGEYVTRPHRIKYSDAKIETAVESLAKQLSEMFENLPNARWVALRLLEGDEGIIRAVREKTLGTLRQTTGFPQLVQLEI